MNEVNMSKTLHFSIQSPENFTRLLSTILFEKSEYYEEFGYLWHTVFNTDDEFGDKIFAQFLKELFPEGKTLNEPEIKQVMNFAIQYLQNDSRCKDLQIDYNKKKYDSWVYSKWNNKLIPCGFGRHAETIRACCIEYFKGMENVIDEDTVKKFILSNFEIRSANSTVRQIAEDSLFIAYSIMVLK